MTNIVIGEGVTTIGNHAFYNCDKLTSFVVPDGVTTISEGVFLDCGRLTSVTIPNSITTIERTVFSYCSSLTNVYYKGTQAEWEQIFVDGSNEDLLNAQITFNN